MVCTVPQDPSKGMLDVNTRTPMSVLRSQDVVRSMVITQSPHLDGPAPVVGDPGFNQLPPPQVPVAVDLTTPEPHLVTWIQGDANCVDQPEARMMAQGAMIVSEHLGSRAMHPSIMRANGVWRSQNVHIGFLAFTKGLIAYVAYCIGRGSWNSPISSRLPTVSRMGGFEDVGRADRFLNWVVRHYEHLDLGNHWMYQRLNNVNAKTGLRYYNIASWMDNNVSRLRKGGVHSPGWLVLNAMAPGTARKDHTMGLLWSNVAVLILISDRLDKYLECEARSFAFITTAQADEITNILTTPANRLF